MEGKRDRSFGEKNGPALVWTGICIADPSVEQARFWSMPGVGCRGAPLCVALCVGMARQGAMSALEVRQGVARMARVGY